MEKLILLIDDDREEYLILNRAIQLAELSHHCVWAYSAERAVQLLGQMLPDLILIDYNMPKTNGIVCLEMIRRMDNMSKVPIVLYSHHISKLTQELALTKGVACMEKSSSMFQLVQYLLKMSKDNTAVAILK